MSAAKVTVSQVEKMKRDVEDLKEKIARGKGRIQQLKLKLDGKGKPIKQELQELEKARSVLEAEYGQLLSQYEGLCNEHRQS